MKARNRVINHIPKNAVGAEIGVHLGDYSQKILAHSNPSRLYLIDPWKVFDAEYKESWYGSNKVTQATMDSRYNSVVERFRNNSNVTIIRELSYNAADQIPDNSLDFVYIDGDHTFEGSCKDFDAFYPKVKTGGFIYGDDYIDNNWWGTGVIDALHKNLYEKKLKLVFLEQDQFCCVKL